MARRLCLVPSASHFSKRLHGGKRHSSAPRNQASIPPKVARDGVTRMTAWHVLGRQHLSPHSYPSPPALMKPAFVKYGDTYVLDYLSKLPLAIADCSLGASKKRYTSTTCTYLRAYLSNDLFFRHNLNRLSHILRQPYVTAVQPGIDI